MIFGIEARPPIGMILGFYGFCHQVMKLMQRLSHRTRAYIVNAEGLPGFVLKYQFDIDIITFLYKADEAGQLEHARLYQNIDLSIVERKLEKFEEFNLCEEEQVEGEMVKFLP